MKAVDGIDFAIRRGETLGLVGESGSGKTTAGRVVLRLLPATKGEVIFEGRDIHELGPRRYAPSPQRDADHLPGSVRVAESADDASATSSASRSRSTASRAGKAAEERVQELLRLVGLQPYHANRYPHEFSGGQRQRIGIARALAVDPKFIVADEPVSALDVSIQAQVINLLQDLQEQLGSDVPVHRARPLGRAPHLEPRRRDVRRQDRRDSPTATSSTRIRCTPTPQALLSAIPIPDPAIEARRKRIILTGDIPSPVEPPSGCRFHTRCPIAFDRCKVDVPAFKEYQPGHFAACHWVEEHGGNAPELSGGIAEPASAG